MQCSHSGQNVNIVDRFVCTDKQALSRGGDTTCVHSPVRIKSTTHIPHVEHIPIMEEESVAEGSHLQLVLYRSNVKPNSRIHLQYELQSLDWIRYVL